MTLTPEALDISEGDGNPNVAPEEFVFTGEKRASRKLSAITGGVSPNKTVNEKLRIVKTAVKVVLDQDSFPFFCRYPVLP